MFRVRSTFNLAKTIAHPAALVRQGSTALPTEFTSTGFRKAVAGTRIDKNVVMGEYGSYSPSMHDLRELMQKDPSVQINSKLGARDILVHRLMLCLLMFQLFVVAPFTMYTLCFNPEQFKQWFIIDDKK